MLDQAASGSPAGPQQRQAMNAGMRMKNETNSSKTGVNALFLKNEMAPNGPKLVSQPTMASNGFTTYNGLKRSHNVQLFSAKELNWIKTFNLSSNEKNFRFRCRQD